MTRSTPVGTLLIAFALMATACGANPSAGSVAPTSAPVARATDAPEQTAATSVPAVAATEAAPAAAAQSGPYAGIDQGRTPEGYQMLGKANAPVTLVMYSDFF